MRKKVFPMRSTQIRPMIKCNNMGNELIVIKIFGAIVFGLSHGLGSFGLTFTPFAFLLLFVLPSFNKNIDTKDHNKQGKGRQDSAYHVLSIGVIVIDFIALSYASKKSSSVINSHDASVCVDSIQIFIESNEAQMTSVFSL